MIIQTKKQPNMAVFNKNERKQIKIIKINLSFARPLDK